ncbi:hypothetical protein G6011_07846 [Alternaria panax]|uniref:Protein BTN n=1 Tax=Alternaria panax TaxID=48097 RepID=A0AAD4F879_9PLEO|nr:hypothetical protein G6011_07846 [Alternaria panax]
MSLLPMPGSPASSWAVYRARFKAVFHGADPRVCTAFWLFGLINNVLYVIILSAALDLVGPNVPKGAVLLADVIPSFLTKLCAPYFIHKIPYTVRILVFVALSACGMLIIALTPPLQDSATIAIKMCGVMLASLSSGGGELSFLGLTHYYGHFALASWGSGTGGAGLVGAGAYAIATNTLGITPRTSLLVFSFLPLIMVLSFFVILPLGPLRAGVQKHGGYEAIDNQGGDEEEEVAQPQEQDDLLSSSMHSAPGRSFTSVSNKGASNALSSFRANLNRARGLFFPYMLPLLLVYIAEYTINQGVAPTLLFPLESSPFDEYRSFYSTYNAIYQVGVFISRSSTPFIRIHHLYVPSFLQVANLIILALHAMFDFIPSYYIVCVIIFWEGLLGGLVYVSTFAEITDNVPKEDREFSLGATSVSDSGGICIAGFLGMAVETGLKNTHESTVVVKDRTGLDRLVKHVKRRRYEECLKESPLEVVDIRDGLGPEEEVWDEIFEECMGCGMGGNCEDEDEEVNVGAPVFVQVDVVSAIDAAVDEEGDDDDAMDVGEEFLSSTPCVGRQYVWQA